jgi:hypothetical protein
MPEECKEREMDIHVEEQGKTQQLSPALISSLSLPH